MISQEQKGHRFLELDALRGLAALAVVLGHYNGTLENGPHPLFALCAHVLGSGHAAVVLFFLLSGFVLTVPYLGPRRPTYTAFLLKRLCRIYLPYVAAISLAALFAARLHCDVPTGNEWIDQSWNEVPSRHLLLQHLLMIGHFNYVQLDSSIWSLVIEMRVSIIFPLIVWLGAKLEAWWMFLIIPPLVWLLALLATRSGHVLFFDTFFFSILFVIGSKLRRNYTFLQTWLNSRTRPQLVALLLAGLLLYRFSEDIPFQQQGASKVFASYLIDSLTALGAVCILMLSTTLIRLRHLLHGRIFQWAGSRSYSVYLLHVIVIMAWVRLGKPGHGLHLSMFNCLGFIAIVALSSEVFHRTIERPALILGRKIAKRTVLNPLRGQ